MTSQTSAFADAAATWDQRVATDEFIFGQQPNEYLRAQAARFAEAFPPYVAQAAHEGIRIALYAVHGQSFVCDNASFEAVWEHVPEVGIKLDPANIGLATANDNCDSNVAITYTDAVVQSQYNVKWYAADPDGGHAPYQPTYLKLSPASLACPDGARLTGRAADPLRNAVAYGPTASTLDALTEAGWWKDDSLICDLRLVKAHGPTPGVMVSFNDIVLVEGEEYAAAKRKLTKG